MIKTTKYLSLILNPRIFTFLQQRSYRLFLLLYLFLFCLFLLWFFIYFFIFYFFLFVGIFYIFLWMRFIRQCVWFLRYIRDQILSALIHAYGYTWRVCPTHHYAEQVRVVLDRFKNFVVGLGPLFRMRTVRFVMLKRVAKLKRRLEVTAILPSTTLMNSCLDLWILNGHLLIGQFWSNKHGDDLWLRFKLFGAALCNKSFICFIKFKMHFICRIFSLQCSTINTNIFRHSNTTIYFLHLGTQALYIGNIVNQMIYSEVIVYKYVFFFCFL